MKPGYKQTDLGVLPEEWDALPLGNVIQLQRGYDLPHRMRVGGAIPIVTSAGVSDTHNKAMVAAPGVVTGRYGTIGDVFYITEDFWPLNTTLFVKDFKGNNPLFTSYLLRTIDFASHSGKSGVPGVNRNDLHELIVALPPPAEQQAIAEVLSAIDALLTAQRGLLAKKRDLKQATQQALLSGETRLPGFSEPSQFETLGQLILNKPTKLPTAGPDELVSFIGMEDVSENGQLLRSRIVPIGEVKRGFTYFERGNVLVAKITPCFENGKGAYLDTLKTSKGFGSTEFHVLKSNDLGDDKYIFFHTQSAKLRESLEGEMVGTAGHRRVPLSAILNYELPFGHSLAEQRAIAAILSDMDVELEALAAQVVKTQALKQGMMQDLLTSAVRLAPATAALSITLPPSTAA